MLKVLESFSVLKVLAIFFGSPKFRTLSVFKVLRFVLFLKFALIVL